MHAEIPATERRGALPGAGLRNQALAHERANIKDAESISS